MLEQRRERDREEPCLYDGAEVDVGREGCVGRLRERAEGAMHGEGSYIRDT